jgi:bacillithiol system protein YtxJ
MEGSRSSDRGGIVVTLKDRMRFLTSPAEVDSFLAQNPQAVVFKAGTCHKTQETFSQVQPLLEDRPDLPLGIIRVVESRSASNRVAEVTGLRHESPQLILFKDGRPVFDRDNWNITGESFAEALGDKPAPALRGDQ